jgi:dienelactone hydrolase
VGYVAHPTQVDKDELQAITGALAIAAAEDDAQFPPEKRHESEDILKSIGVPYQINFYSGVSHG